MSFKFFKRTSGNNDPLYKDEDGRVGLGVIPLAGYDPIDDMLKVKSVQNKFRDSFTKPLTTNWDITSDGMTASIANGELTIVFGTTAGSYLEMISKDIFTIPFKYFAGYRVDNRRANQHLILELVSVDPITGVVNELDNAAWRLTNTTVTQGVYEVAHDGLVQLSSAASTILTSASYSILELEPFADECYFHSRTMDATTVRGNSYVRHQQIPDPNAAYKLRIRAINGITTPINITNAIAGTGNVIRVTAASHGMTTNQKCYIDYIKGVTNNGNLVHGQYTITQIDANTFELQGTVFGGTYVAGSGRVFSGTTAPAGATSAIFQFISAFDYAELTAEITAGRGQIAGSQGLGVNVIGTVPVTATGVAGTAAHDAVVSGSPVRIAGRAVTANYTGVATGDVADIVTTVVGAQIVKPYGIPEADWQYGSVTPITTTADLVVKAAAAAGIRNYVTGFQYQNTNATPTNIQIKDGSTVIWAGQAPANMNHPAVIMFNTPLKGTAAAAINIACGSTGASVLVAVQGYIAP